ncbi:adenine phosphoribosyltransferase [Krasilnikovia cinnamomea]|uniref:adenine phosphoribosyltransferase n=1 Tax=Krasilnikovia cinnamomea TaxID=349313 RepID=A0A4Q7ZKQ8_9ACTN|nr:phosphoribosyltransferase family protein [Krasilnikovia cinnamomea]RZU50923.1 adenine phosphoribosyltransferase [Krasilnikovia cinnamomea]
MPSDLHDLLRAAFRWTDPGPGSGYLVSDRSGWWRDPTILDGLGPALAGLFPGAGPTVVIAPEITGFLIGPLVARALGAGFVEVYREGSRLPIAEPMTWADVPADHRGARQRLGLRTRLLGPADRVLVVDDWIATGAQARAVHALAAARGAAVIGTAVIVADCDPATAAELNVRSLVTGTELSQPT